MEHNIKLIIDNWSEILNTKGHIVCLSAKWSMWRSWIINHKRHKRFYMEHIKKYNLIIWRTHSFAFRQFGFHGKEKTKPQRCRNKIDFEHEDTKTQSRYRRRQISPKANIAKQISRSKYHEGFSILNRP